MKKATKFLSLALASATALSLVACGGKATNNDTQGASVNPAAKYTVGIIKCVYNKAETRK